MRLAGSGVGGVGDPHDHRRPQVLEPAGEQGGTVASGPKVPLAGSNLEPLPVQTAARSPQSNQSWHRRWRSVTLVEDAGLSGRQMQQCPQPHGHAKPTHRIAQMRPSQRTHERTTFGGSHPPVRLLDPCCGAKNCLVVAHGRPPRLTDTSVVQWCVGSCVAIGG
jgi:hypothetical protein